MRRQTRAILALLSLVGGIGLGSVALRANEASKNISIIYTDDTKGTLEPCG